jgi:malate dehydrogenase (oxaloacetate-decarboxylating)
MPRISRYFDIVEDRDGREVMEVYLEGIALLRLVLINKGTAFSEEERIALRLDGMLPPQVSSLEEQVARVYRGFQHAKEPLEKYQFLRALQERQEILFYAVLERHLEEMMPIVYTPTVGEAVKQFSFLYQSPRGLSLSPLNIGRAATAVNNYPFEDVRMIVATDSSAILGIGDQGYGGLAIPIGKLALYTVGGGVSPFHTMPVSLDVGTDRQDLLDDPLYLGVRQRRMKGDAYLQFVDKFVGAVKARWPNAVVQWEDLSKETAFTVLERYRKELPSFNDDIQGTGATALAGLLSACRLTGRSLADERVVIHGAGAGGVGVAWAIREGMVREGLSREEASARIFVLDSRGLLTDDRSLEEYKRPFAQAAARVAGWAAGAGSPSLLETIRGAKASVLIGLSGQPGAFPEEAIRAVAANVDRPVIFPMSNPTSSSEAVPADVFAWTDGRAIVATGSPFDPVEHGGKRHPIGQGNNAFCFPGIGFGAILARAREITDGMVLEAAYALADYTAERHVDRGLIYPPVDELQEVSIRVAARVLGRAVADGVANGLPEEARRDPVAYVRSRFWKPRYYPVVRG